MRRGRRSGRARPTSGSARDYRGEAAELDPLGKADSGRARWDVPRLIFFSFDPENEPGLSRRFPYAEFQHGSDPRWDRVFQRSERSPSESRSWRGVRRSPAALGRGRQRLGVDFARFPPTRRRPFPAPSGYSTPGRPALRHSARNSAPRTRIHAGADRFAGACPAGGQNRGARRRNRIPRGILFPTDWAFIGGGFGANIHSTIEPAIYGLADLRRPARPT